jgi:hypothetical protein
MHALGLTAALLLCVFVARLVVPTNQSEIIAKLKLIFDHELAGLTLRPVQER